MSKKKKKKSGGQQFLSPERYIRERMRSLEIGDCYFSAGLPESKFGIVFVTRLHHGGKKSVANYLVDMDCLGIKDSDYALRLDEYEYDQKISEFNRKLNLKKVPYVEAHNLLYGALEFAEEAGIKPHMSWNLTRYFLEEDNEDIPLIEYDYGLDGKHYLMANSTSEAKRYLPVLEKNLGKGNYEYTVAVGRNGAHGSSLEEEEDYEYEERHRRWQENRQKMQQWVHPYSYKRPDYPNTLEIANKDILTLISGEETGVDLPDKVIDKILSHDPKTLKQDLENVILYYIGRTWNVGPHEENENYSLANAVTFLAEVGDSEHSLDVVFEVMRQTSDFTYYHFQDGFDFMVVPTLVKLGHNNLKAFSKFIYEKGLDIHNKIWVVAAVQYMAACYPEMRDEVHDWFADLVHKIISDFQHADYTDGQLNAHIVSCLIDLQAKDMLNEVKWLYDHDFVSFSVCGPYEDAEYEFVTGQTSHQECHLDIHERFQDMRSAFGWADKNDDE